MARQFTGNFPRASSVFRVEWRSAKPLVIQLRVVSRSTASVTLEDPKGKQQTVTGRKELQKFGGSVEDAVLIAFQEICDEVTDEPQKTPDALRKAAELAKLL